MHPHQVRHNICCPGGSVNTCEARCFAELQSDPGSRDICCVEAWKLTDGECHPFLQCYCEEKNSPPCMPPVSICSARWARASSESWRGCRVVCTLNPAPPPSRQHKPSHSILRSCACSLFGGIVPPGGRSITPPTPTPFADLSMHRRHCLPQQFELVPHQHNAAYAESWSAVLVI